MGRMQSQDTDTLKSRVERLVQMRAEAAVPHYYLSRLGNQLQDEGYDVRRLTGASLEILLVGMGYQIDSASDQETDKFIYTSSSRSKPKKSVRYSKKLWNAFDTPLAQGRQRFINLRTLNFGTTDEVRSGADEVREIADLYISDGPTDRAADVVRERISRWLEEQALPLEAFADERPARRTSDPRKR